MDPTAAPGELLTITNLDLTAFDVARWNPVPEPALWMFGIIALPMLIILHRRRRQTTSRCA